MKYLKLFLLLVCVGIVTGCNLNINNGTNSEKKYQVTFMSDGEIVTTTEVQENQTLEKPTDPKKDGYEFSGWYQGSRLWNFEEDKVTENITLIANWEKEEAKSAMVSVYNEQGELLKTFEAAIGKIIPLYTVNKLTPGYEIVEFSSDGKTWNIKEDVVRGDMDLVLKVSLITYTIKYYHNDTLLDGLEPVEYTVESSASIDLPSAPIIDGYEFVGWYENGVRVVTFFSSDAEDKIFTAKYQKIETPADSELTLPSNVSHMFTNIKKVEISGGTGYVYQPDFTGLSVTMGVQNYNWTSLNPEIVSISQWSSMSVVSPGYAIIQAVNKNDSSIVICAVVKVTSDGIVISSLEEANTKVTYEVTFVDDNGSIIEVQTVEENKNAILPTPPVKDGYTFIGWSEDHVNIKSNMTIQAIYTEGSSNFVGKTVSILGDSISTYKNYIPDGYSSFYPYPTADVSDVNYTWWMRTINSLGMTLLKNNSYSGSCVSAGTGSSGATNDARLIELLKGTERPDIIFLFMGANDCGSANVSLTTFTSSYRTMLEKIQILCPNSEIYLMTLPSCGLYKEADKNAYNEVIKGYAEEFNLPLIDLATLYTQDSYKDYVVDSCHPNNAGMIKISDAIVKTLLKENGIILE